MIPPTTIDDPTPIVGPSSAGLLPGGQFIVDTQQVPAAGDLLATDQLRCDAQSARVGGEPSPVAASPEATTTAPALLPEPFSTTTPIAEAIPSSSSSSSPGAHTSSESHSGIGAGLSESPVPPMVTTNSSRVAAGGWLELRIWAEMLHDAQLARIAAGNRAARGGVDPGVYEAHVEQLASVEHACALAMRRCFRRVVPAELVAWQKEQRGIGEHLVARLLGHLGDPLIATPHQWTTTPPQGHVCDPAHCGDKRHLVALEPYQRTVSQLWAYCGHGDPARKKHKGMTADEAFGLGSPGCKMLVHLLAEACMKQKPGNRYRDIYENRRLLTVERVHAAPCVRCGPSGKPAVAGSPWSKAHQHADALRVVGKELLRDMWRIRHAASQGLNDIQITTAGGELLKEAS